GCRAAPRRTRAFRARAAALPPPPPLDRRSWLLPCQDLLEAGLLAQAFELRLDSGASQGEASFHLDCLGQAGERLLPLAAQGVDAGRVVAREGIVRAEPDAL